MRHRIFLAINLPVSIKEELLQYSKKWPELPARWTKPANLHITLEFIGYISSENLQKILKTVESVVLRYSSFEMEISRISYGPLNKMPAKMVWAVIKNSDEFNILKKDLQESLKNANIYFSIDQKPAIIHITLARIRSWDFRNFELEEVPEINEEVYFNFKVNSIEIMESKLKKGSPEYTVLQSYKLNNK